MRLTDADQGMLDGADGPAAAMAMRLVVGMARANGAKRLTDIASAHIDGALYSGPASLDFVQRLVDLGGAVRVPTTLNVSSLDLLHPELYRGPHRAEARATMQAYEDLGCRPTWTCAPYQLPDRPSFGERVAWAESNAIVFANTVLGARSDRFGDFIDIACAITGRAPEAGMFLDENRRAAVRYDVSGLSRDLMATDEAFAVLGLLIGRDVGREIPVITGIESATEDQLKVMGAASATSGTVPMLHVVGITPEAPTLEAATGGRQTRDVEVTAALLAEARDSLSADLEGPLRTINVGTPHYSAAQVARLTEVLAGRAIDAGVEFYVNIGRDVLGTIPNVAELEALGISFVADTCTYITPIIEHTDGIALTDSAKWAYYAPGNLGIDVAFGSISDCVESAVAGHLVRDETTWQ